MSTQPEMTNVSDNALTPVKEVTASGQRGDMLWLLRQFVTDVPGVSHALLLSRDGLQLLDSDIEKDWADELSAAFSAIASISGNVTGPSKEQYPASQVVIERADCNFFVQSAGHSAVFENRPGSKGLVDTVLVVVATPDADAGTVGFETGRLVQKFAPYMQVPVRVDAPEDVR